MEIYYEKSGQKIGPIKISQLDSEALDRKTLVWHKGLEDWVDAEAVQELSDYFNNVPPHFLVQKSLLN